MEPKQCSITILIIACLAFGIGGYAQSGGQTSNWPQWRGPQGSGISDEKNLPDEWNATRNILWKTPVPGRGHSSPIVWGNRIFLSTDLEGEVVPGAKAVHHDRKGETWV